MKNYLHLTHGNKCFNIGQVEIASYLAMTAVGVSSLRDPNKPLVIKKGNDDG
jgi:hypothetical protein